MYTVRDPKVTVLCTTYNQERYVRKCLESLVNQDTSFEYEIIVHDDASTDKTQEIIKEFEDKYSNILAIYQTENQYSKGVRVHGEILAPIIKGEYIAICEGDDFWTSNEKLQKQFDYMENHPECSLCAHAAYYANEKGELLTDKFFRIKESSGSIDMETILSGWSFATNSLMYRKNLYNGEIIPYRGKCRNGDFCTTAYLGLKGQIYYIDELMSAYRYISVGSLNWNWNRDDKFFIEARTEFIDMLGRLDSYSDRKYHDCIEKYKNKMRLSLYQTVGDLPNAKALGEIYDELSFRDKTVLYIKYYIPWLGKFLKIVKQHFN